MGFPDNPAHRSQERHLPVEDHLSGILKPVTPRTEFVNGLRGKILHIQNSANLKWFPNWQLYLLVLLAAFCGGMLLVMFSRLLTSFFLKHRGNLST